jgi:tRNA pseudouridine55 synthase
MACGLLLLNKPEGVRSTVCVAALRRALPGRQKVGHGGTLDSTAQGLLILLVGGATRASELVMGLPKIYDVEIRLGEERSTDDYSGEVSFSGPVPQDAAELAEVFLPSFLGTRLQVPPAVSAIHVNGVRAHALSRSGKEPVIQPRPVRVTDIRILSGPKEGNDTLKLRIRCSRGTYVRSVVRDLGRRLGCGAHVSSLVRTATGLFRLGDALAFDELQRGSLLKQDCLHWQPTCLSFTWPYCRRSRLPYAGRSSLQQVWPTRTGLRLPLQLLSSVLQFSSCPSTSPIPRAFLFSTRLRKRLHIS